MSDTDLERLLDFNRRRYWLTNGWCIRFQVKEHPLSAGRPFGIKYSFTLHDVDMTRLLGFDNSHGIPHKQLYDHKHRFRKTDHRVPYVYKGADDLISDFFAEVEQACKSDGVDFQFDSGETELEEHDDDHDDDEKVPG